MSSSDADLRPPNAKQPRTASESEEEEDGWRMLMDDIYVEQHFNTTADELVDKIFNLSLQHIMTLVPTLKKSLVQVATTGKEEELKETIIAKIDAGLRKYIEGFYSVLEYNSDTLLLYVKKYIINIPENLVLPKDQIQFEYRGLVKSLQQQRAAGVSDFTEENTTDRLSSEADELCDKLLKLKCEKAKLKNQMQKADTVIRRLEALETLVESVTSEMKCVLNGFVLQNISAAIDMPSSKTST